jgi:hypothetical protein
MRPITSVDDVPTGDVTCRGFLLTRRDEDDGVMVLFFFGAPSEVDVFPTYQQTLSSHK